MIIGILDATVLYNERFQYIDFFPGSFPSVRAVCAALFTGSMTFRLDLLSFNTLSRFLNNNSNTK